MAGNYQIGAPSKEWMSAAPALAAALRNRAGKMFSLDTPQDQDATDIGADIAAGFTPGVGEIQSLRDFERARREGNKFDMGLSALGLIPFVAGGIKTVKAAAKGGKVANVVGATEDAAQSESVVDALRAATPSEARVKKPNLKRDGVQVTDLTDAEKRFSNGEPIYAFHEQGGQPMLIDSVETLRNYEPEQLLAVSPGGKVAEGAAELSSRAKAGAEQRMLTEAIDGSEERAKYLRRPTVVDPKVVAFPGIYKRPDELVAGAKVAPENPMMQRLFGVNRDDLFQIAQEGRRQGNMTGFPFRTAANPRGAAHAGRIMTPQNEQRILDIIGETKKRPDLYKGMAAWYTMDPLYKDFVRLYGKSDAPKEYNRFNALVGMASPNSEVLTEINRGTGAFMLDTAGRFDDFKKYGGIRVGDRGANHPSDMRALQGHLAHSTAQAGPMEKYLRAGKIDMDSPKVPSYVHASGVPETGFQTAWPVGDAHWSRIAGLPDVRGFRRDPKSGLLVPNGSSASTPEMVTLGPWWRDKIAAKADLEAVPAQAIVWGAGSNATGVTSPVGAPKLELLAQHIAKAAKRLDVSPEEARDLILMGKEHAGFADPALLATVAGGAATGATVAALRNRKKEQKP